MSIADWYRRRPPPSCARTVRVSVVGLRGSLMASLDRALEVASAHAPMSFERHDGPGELALVDARLAADLDDDEWSTLFGARPVVALIEPGAPPPRLRTPYRVSTRLDDDDLLSTLGAIPELRQRGLPMHVQRGLALELLRVGSPFAAELLRRFGDRAAPTLLAGYPEGDSLLIDFERHEVIADARAWERLRARRELPRIAEGGFRPAALTPQARPRGLDQLVWASGLAAADLALLDAPAHWQHTRLVARGWLHVTALTRMPAHLHLAEQLAAGATTPYRLRRATRVDERELRAFLQAALFMQAAQWQHAE